MTIKRKSTGYTNENFTGISATPAIVQSPCIIDVGWDEEESTENFKVPKLPKGWTGTTVPSTGFVEKIYFNTKLKPEEVLLQLNKLNYVTTDVFPAPLYVVAASSDFQNAIVIMNLSDNEGISYGIVSIINGVSTTVFVHSTFESEEGVIDNWTGVESVDLNIENILGTIGNNLGYTDMNLYVNHFISTTPFENDPRNDKAFYRDLNGNLWMWQNEWIEIGTNEDATTKSEVQEMIQSAIYDSWDGEY